MRERLACTQRFTMVISTAPSRLICILIDTVSAPRAAFPLTLPSGFHWPIGRLGASLLLTTTTSSSSSPSGYRLDLGPRRHFVHQLERIQSSEAVGCVAPAGVRYFDLHLHRRWSSYSRKRFADTSRVFCFGINSVDHTQVKRTHARTHADNQRSALPLNVGSEPLN